MKRLTEKLDRIEQTGVLEMDFSWLNNNYQRSLASYVRKCDAHRLREVEPFHRYGALVCFLWQTYQDTIDFAVDMHYKLINKAEKNAKKTFDEELKQRRKAILSSLNMFQTVGGVLLDKRVENEKVRQVIFSQVPPDVLAQQLAELDDWVTGKRSHLFSAFIDQFNYLRKFSPAFLECLEFEDSRGTDTPLIHATELLRKMNATNKRKVPEDAPTEFVSKTIRPLVVSDGVIDKHGWECALIRKIRDEIKAGNIAVKNSKRFGTFDRFFISDTKWSSLREEFFAQSGLPQKGCDAATYLSERLNLAYDRFLGTLPNNTYAQVDGAGWHLSVDSAEPLDPTEEAKIDQFKNWIKKHQRQIKLPQLLIEVDNELHFTRHFLPLTQNQTRPVDEIAAIIAAIMAHGCNVGPQTMSQLTAQVTYEQIRRITEWQLIEENQRSALADVVNAISSLETTQNWGEGKTSASDGQRFAFHRRVLQRNYSHKFSDYALEFYSFIADNYAPFYGVPIECNERDAPYVLDGVLYNESDLELEEHYTDTHGYTEINFAAFAMLGKEFCPRIRKISKQRIYCIDQNRDYGALAPLFNRKGRTTIKMDWIVDQWDRMGQFYATLKSGHTTASVALKRLNSMSKGNQFYRANRELGRIKKTEFILKYMSLPPLRRRIRRGLLKVDQLHSLARDVAYAKQGRITKRDFYEIMKSCSCLTLILAGIIYWQAKEIGRVIVEYNPQEGVDTSLLEHVSPIEWENVVLYGEYVIDRNLIR
jgi:TnpA family transposase